MFYGVCSPMMLALKCVSKKAEMNTIIIHKKKCCCFLILVIVTVLIISASDLVRHDQMSPNFILEARGLQASTI